MEFVVEGEPQGKARPRFSRRSGTVYTPAKTAKYEKEIRQAFLDAGGKMIPAGSYVAVTVDAYFSIPKSYTKRKRLECEHNIKRPDKKPDIDNVVKVVLDALNKVAYEDDKQVIGVICRKWYSRSSGFLKIQILEDER
nr:MAG TPA: Endodeoxyribonuclease RusA [Caudoviricetes sp.]